MRAQAYVRTLSRADVEENDLVALLLLVVNTVDVVGEIESLNGESCLFLLPYLKNVIRLPQQFAIFMFTKFMIFKFKGF